VPQRDGELSTAVEAAQDFVTASRSKATLRAYKSDWDNFEKWCDRHCLITLPATPAGGRRLPVGNGDGPAAGEAGHTLLSLGRGCRDGWTITGNADVSFAPTGLGVDCPISPIIGQPSDELSDTRADG
jgi:hypothetical protein